jgi:hypothetical protein
MYNPRNVRLCYYLITETNLSYGYRVRSIFTILDLNRERIAIDSP